MATAGAPTTCVPAAPAGGTVWRSRASLAPPIMNAWRLASPTTKRSPPGVSSSGARRLSGRFTAAAAAAAHRVKLIGPDGTEAEVEVPEDGYILEAAEAAGVELPSSCRAGSCATCAGKLASGEVDQSEGSFLDEAQMAEGYVLTCIAYPRTDCVIYTHKEKEVH